MNEFYPDATASVALDMERISKLGIDHAHTGGETHGTRQAFPLPNICSFMSR